MKGVVLLNPHLECLQRALHDRLKICNEQLSSPIAKSSEEFVQSWEAERDLVVAIALMLAENGG